jgi:hypothetical protein
MIDTEVVEELVNHHYFQPHITPVQLKQPPEQSAAVIRDPLMLLFTQSQE